MPTTPPDPGPTTPPEHPRPAPTTPPARHLAGLVAVLTLVTLELVRASGPLLDMAFSRGVVAAAGSAVVAYAVLPGVLGPVLRAVAGTAPHRGVLTGALGLAALRLLVQALEGGARFVVGLVTVALAVTVLTHAAALLTRRPDGGRAAARAVAVGAAGAVGLQLVLGTWDAFWRDGVLGWAVVVVVVTGLVLLARGAAAEAVRTATDGPGAAAGGGRTWALGPALALLAMLLANPAFAASQSGLPLAVAGPVAAGGLLLAAAVGATPRPAVADDGVLGVLGRARPWLDAALLVALTGLLVPPVGVSAAPTTLGALVLVQLLGVGALATALGPAPRARTSPRPPLLTPAAVGLGTILPLLVFQVDYDVPLGFPNELVLAATALALGLAGVRRLPGASRTTGAGARAPRSRVPAPGPGRAVVAVAAALVVAGSALTVAGHVTTRSATAEPPSPETPGEGVVVSWNLHYLVDHAGDVDLERVARTIEDAGADVVLLQEVPRGWVMGAGADGATWLAQRLGMRVAFAPAADRQFGNAVLARGRLRDVEVVPLPYGAGPQQRSALRAVVPLGGSEVTAVSVHLQHREENTPTRLEQLDVLLDALGDGPVVLGGDLNAEPGWPELDVVLDAGLTSAQDAVGDPAALTTPSTAPRHRIDWVLVRGHEPLAHEVLDDALSSDHLPLVTRVRVG